MVDDQRENDSPFEDMDDKALSPEQFRKYAEDLARIYQSEREKRAQLEVVIEELQERTDQLLEEIHQRRIAEEKIREQAALIDIAPETILVCDLNNKITFANPSARQMYGRKEGELEGTDILELFPRDSVSVFNEAKNFVFRMGEWNGRFQQIGPAGKLIPVESRWTLMYDDDNKPKSLLIINTDMSATRELEDKFYHAQRISGIGLLASGIAHDLNNILTPIYLGISRWESMMAGSERVLKDIKMIDENARRAAELVKQVLTYSRAGESEISTVQLKQLIKETLVFIRNTFPKSIEVSSFVAKDLWAVSGNFMRLHQVLLNLCINARDAMPHGGNLNISAENKILSEEDAAAYRDGKAGYFVMISVADTGTGIPEVLLDKIFEPFFTTKEAGKGTGLGLSIVADVVKEHGGFLYVQTEIGKRTEFRIFIQAAPDEEKHDREKIAIHPGEGQLVLIVESEADICRFAGEVLEDHGYRALTAGYGAEAITLYNRHRDSVDVLLVDKVLPGMSCYALIRTLRKVNPDLKVIITDASMTDESVESNLAGGADACLAKPYFTAELCEAIQTVLTD